MTLKIGIVSSLVMIALSCNNVTPGNNDTGSTRDKNTEEEKHESANALNGLAVMEGLGITTVATEPMLKNPTNIDVDDRGRIWVTEAYNYRPARNGNPTNEKGDRIIILEDTDKDGIIDSSKLFYQGPELNAPLGICVLGNRVIVSQSPFVWSFYDDDGDDKADRKEILFQGIGGEQHDHGAHAFTFGPDGKLYFNMGNEGKTLQDKNGKTILDQDGDEITPKKYKQGIVIRCNPDGSEVEVLGQNFRNPFELAVDSYGTLWQSDNDDDGNRGVRINYVMQYGNYGYKDEMTNTGWQQKRTNMEDSIPLRHWHLNDPGVVPNLLQTFAGSPTGMTIYEGELLPPEFYNQMIHADAGQNVVRAYLTNKSGAGYMATIKNILEGKKDQWFRPADVCVAPDGSLIIADWYDPGVGGHQAGDQTKGRIYRVAPIQSKYTIPVQNYTTASGALQALQNPCLSVRFKAWTALQSMGKTAVPHLEKLWTSSANPKLRARAFWVLLKMQGADIKKYITEAVLQNNPEFKIMALRAARALKLDVITLVRSLYNTPDMQVKRECALALHHNVSAAAADLWVSLAMAYDGKDRWYLEALGIGAHDQWDKFFKAFVMKVENPLETEAYKDIVWRARSADAVPFIATLATDETVPLAGRLKYFRAFDFNSGPLKYEVLLNMVRKNTSGDTAITRLALRHLDKTSVQKSSYAQKALEALLSAVRGTAEYLDLIRKYEVKSENKGLLQMSIIESNKPEGSAAADILLKSGGRHIIWNVLNDDDTVATERLLTSLGKLGNKESRAIFGTIILSGKYPVALRRQAANKIGKSGGGQDLVLKLLKEKKVPPFLIENVVASVKGAWRKSIVTEAANYLPGASTTAAKTKPTMTELALLNGNAIIGKKIYLTTCSVCHKVGSEGFDFGPALTEIGTKYPKEGLFESIMHPSKGISFGYESSEIALKDGTSTSGIIANKTKEEVDLKLPGGTRQQIKTRDIKRIKELSISMMPEGLHESMSSQDLANLLEYLGALKKK